MKLKIPPIIPAVAAGLPTNHILHGPQGAQTGTTANSFHINGSNQWDTVYYYNWTTATSTFDPVERDYQIYDSYGNLLHAGGFMYNTGTSSYATTPYDLNSFYYQTYSTTGINNVVPVSATVTIFPNPVAHKLYISIQGLGAGKKTKVMVTDLLGRSVSRGEVTGTDITEIDLSAQARGTYIVTVSGEGVYHTEKVVKSE